MPAGKHRSEIATVSRRKFEEGGDDGAETELALDVPAREMLVKVIEDFDRAGHVLLMLAAMRPVHLQYMAKNSNGDHRYLLLMTLADGQQKKYVFAVAESPQNSVYYPDDFSADFAGSIDLTRPLIDAIRNLYLACNTVA